MLSFALFGCSSEGQGAATADAPDAFFRVPSTDAAVPTTDAAVPTTDAPLAPDDTDIGSPTLLVCGDGFCMVGESYLDCPEDCTGVCGDGICGESESTTSCPEECGSACGDGACNGDESTANCVLDCGAECGDDVCNGGETTTGCAEDCGTSCGDGACNGDEATDTCQSDCGSSCGDGACNGTETSASCVDDCGSTCGDGTCTGAEGSTDCPTDCGTDCGDGACNGEEASQPCPEDCGTYCGDGVCFGDENSTNCVTDCDAVCGDGTCNGAETSVVCVADCGANCGDGTCNGAETSVVCVADCGAKCEDGACNGDEAPATCPDDCGSTCGDGDCVATHDEDCLTCAADCACSCNEACIDGGCVDNCVDTMCGDDGCGGSCGSCAANEACVQGACDCQWDCGAPPDDPETFSPQCASPPCVTGLGAELVALSFPPAVEQGTAVSATLHYMNVGSETWEAGVVALGAVDDSDTLCATNRIALEAAVEVGSVATFTVVLQAPTLPAPRRVRNVFSDWQLVSESTATEWFGPVLGRWVSVYDASPVPTDSLIGKVLAGYQGWFATPDGPTPAGWRHWCKAGAVPTPTTVTFDLWPDLREWSESELTPTEFVYPDGAIASLYSAYHFHTVERHVRWMKEYGLDGVWLQRFASELGDPVFADFRDTVTEHMAEATEAHGRVFAIMYDISGMSETPSIFDQIVADWKHLVDDLGVTDSPRYMHHGGRPVLGLWGPGFEGRPGEPVGDQALIEHLQSGIEPAYRVTVMGGVPQGWRTLSGSSKPGYSDVYDAYDLISPWTVGAYSADGYGSFKQSYTVPDLAQQGASAYAPVIWPGFSWKNLQANQNGGSGALNQHPRYGGTFLWDQAWGAYSAGATMGYIAMFDEVDESTAIFKAAETAAQTPTTGTFLSLDADGYALPSDWYLRLAGEVVNLFRGVYSNQPTLPLVVTEGGDGCGDGSCAPGVEDCGSCAQDCPCPTGTSCQDHLCVEDGPDCGDGACAPGVEDCGSCPGDCPCPTGTSCQDHLCVEDGPDCGDGACAPGVEDCGSCPGDCPCPTGTSCLAHQCVAAPDCGDGLCELGAEGCSSCPVDCPCEDSGLCVGDECVEF